MPLINGMKMACEPCIRGHRSTKCTHANERLMVPVRKPGRPLSACPHPRDQTCGCGSSSVTAAIPRKQACRCGSNSSGPTATPAPKPSNSALADLPSPSKATFKVVKPNQQRPSSSRKQSFDPVNLQRMDVNQINILPHNIPVSVPNGYPTSDAQSYNMPVQYANIQPQYVPVPMQPPPHRQSIDEAISRAPIANGTNGYNTIISDNLDHVMESPLATPTLFANGETKFMNGGSFGFPEAGMPHYNGNTKIEPNGSSCCAPTKAENGNSEYLANGNNNTYTNRGIEPNGSSCCAPSKTENGNPEYFANGNAYTNHGLPATNGNGLRRMSLNGGSCCAPKKTHSQSSSSSSISELLESQTASCCSSKSQPSLKEEPISNAGTPQIPHQILPQNGVDYNTSFYQPYPPQTTIFTYPATYGSFQNPLQPAAWRQNIRDGNYTQPILPQEQLPFDAPLLPRAVDTVHTCSCGDGCQCIGCAAHPYNDATQDYVRSAWESMSLEQSTPREVYNTAHTNGNGIAMQPATTDPLASPNAHTPSSTTSGNGEEQSLSANDFFFVNYNFPSDGCGGDTYSCPCGDDCQCIGCEIHKGGSSSL